SLGREPGGELLRETRALFLGQSARPGDIPENLYARRCLVDVLPAGTGSARDAHVELVARNRKGIVDLKKILGGDRSGIAHQRQRKSLSAAKKETTPHTSITSIWGLTAAKDAPSSMLARSASFTAVSGNSLMKGCTMRGKFADEKNTPEKIHIGSMMKLMFPDTASVVRARDAVRSPKPPKEIAASTQIRNSIASEPRSGTPNAQWPNPTRVTTSRIRKTR